MSRLLKFEERRKSDVLVNHLENEEVNIENEFKAMLALARKMRVKITQEWSPNQDWKLPQGLVANMDKLCKIFDTLTACEVRLEKHRTERANKMTREELLDAARRLVMEQTPKERFEWLRKIFPRSRHLENAIREHEDGTDAPAPEPDGGTPPPATP